MTREEAIKELSYIADEMPSMECRDWKEAICMAIKALERKPCGDYISRQDAIEAINDLPNCDNGYSDTYDKAHIISVLEELPPVE